MTKKKNFGLKEKCVKFYDEYKGDKVYFSTFYSRVRLNPQGDMEYAIKPRVKCCTKRKTSPIFTGAYAEEMKWWFYQPEPKAGRQVFYGRVRIGYAKEQAILTGDKWQKVLEEKPIKKKSGYKCHTTTKQDIARREEDYTGIDITYSKEEAKVFRKEYVRIIGDLEWSLNQLEEKTLVKEVNDKLDLMRAELALFNSYNPQ